MNATPDPLAAALDVLAGQATTEPTWVEVQRRAGVRHNRTRRRARPRSLLLLAAALLALAGAYAAAAAERYVPAPWQTDEATPDPGEEQAYAHMAVFKTPATPEDALPPRIRRIAETLNPSSVTEDLLPGAPSLADSRHLYGPPDDGGVYAFPTAKGKVCLLGKFGAGCIGGFDLATHPVDPTFGESGKGVWSVFGPAPDEVVGVDVLRPDGTRTATLGRNYFIYHQPPGDPLPTALVVHLADGGTVTMPTLTITGP